MVDNHDDPTVPANTFRAWFIGTIFVGAGYVDHRYIPRTLPNARHSWRTSADRLFPLQSVYKPVLHHPSTRYHGRSQCCSATCIPRWQTLGSNPPVQAFYHLGLHVESQPREVQLKGAHSHHNHGKCRILYSIHRECTSHRNFSGVVQRVTKGPQTIWVQYLPLYFDQAWASNFGYQSMYPASALVEPRLITISVTVALSTNFIGYGLAGLTRRFLVYPSQAVWPGDLAIIALIRAFHTESNDVVNGWAVSRMRWFMYCFTAMFVYFWFPNYILQAMSYFNWITWIAPENVKLAAVAGSVTGLGLNPLPTFDWNQFNILTSPLINPFFVSTVPFPRDRARLYLFLTGHHECKAPLPRT